MTRISLISSILALLIPMASAMAEETPQEKRHELMEGVGDAAKPVGGMLKGELEFDAEVVRKSIMTWWTASNELGQLFPEGSETGYDTEAKSTIWSNPDGFVSAQMDWAQAIQKAVVANPQTLEDLKPLAGDIFKQCKACHEDFRVEKED